MQSRFRHIASLSATTIGCTHRNRLLSGSIALLAVSFAFDANTAAQAGDTVRYAFCTAANCPDGYAPTADLVATSTRLYGTAFAGGSGYGTVFSVNPNGTNYTVLHTFGSIANDGLEPYAGLVKIGNRLYGTTLSGGQYNSGTVFSVKTNGTGYTLLHSFCSLTACTDGEVPYSSLIDVGGTLYGTTILGGTGTANGYCSSSGCGTVFEVQPNGAGFQVLYSFCSLAGCPDGAMPAARLLDVGGTLYSTTVYGGAWGFGTVFSVSPCGPPPCAEAVVYSFGTNTPDGQNPWAGLTYKTVGSVGYLYGTTAFGGASGNGTVFSVLPCGIPPCTRPGLYSFAGGPTDGVTPYSDLLGWGAYLYGTTGRGGAFSFGTAFKVKANGLAAETLINSFANVPDGAIPDAGLVRIGSELYGTTAAGGSSSFGCTGCGTLFSIP